MGLALGMFFYDIADRRIGGTYITLLHSVNNFGLSEIFITALFVTIALTSVKYRNATADL